jgi:two-component system, cell cycle sensor histidine kinase and response regulator CckA
MNQGSEVILVVEDEEIMRCLINDILTRFGYEILLAADGMEAVEIYKAEHQRIALVILDLFMPKMSGDETFQELRQINPDIKALFSTGYSQNIKIQDLLKTGIKGLIPKPFSVTELIQSVRTTLNENKS